MKIKDIKKILNATTLTNFSDEDADVKFGFASDLMSDVLCYAHSDTLLITGLNNPQVIRTAEMLDIPCVLFVRGKQPSKETIQLASENMITVLATEYIMFKACGLLYESGLEGY
jgi:predicted transcriptional regulator